MSRSMLAAVLLLGLIFGDKSPPIRAQESKPVGSWELHMVTLYEGSIRTGNTIHGGKAEVIVDRPGREVTLILSAYEPITWEVTLAKDATLEKVVLLGYGRQAVKGVPPTCTVVEAFRGGPAAIGSYLGHSIADPATVALAKQLARLEQLPISSFQGRYAFASGRPIRVNEVQSHPFRIPGEAVVRPLSELAELRFAAMHIVPGKHHFDLKVSLGPFTLNGPVSKELRPLPDRCQAVVEDPLRHSYFAIGWHAILKLDHQLRNPEELDVGLDVPQLSWPCGIAFDTKSDRLLVATLGGEGFLYSYDPMARKWSVIASLENLDFGAIAYSTDADALFGIASSRDEAQRWKIYRFNKSGAVLNAVLLPNSLNLGRLDPGRGPQLIAVGSQLIIIAPPAVDVRKQEIPFAERVLVADIELSKFWAADGD